MDRPLSAASSGTAPLTTSGPTHRRTASSTKNGIKPTGSTAISLFVTNLRLLNLDLLPDWPNITVSSFSNQDARTRIKCTEYALYQLFRLHDPATTADKLQPFFPPLEPLQSVNLRAALYRCLNELKKNGVLSKETVLRKSMLDECQGERFWEICLSFSSLVLRKRALEKRSKHGKSIAERLGTANGVSKSQKESMLPLAIAHRVSLVKVLKEKQDKRNTYARLYDIVVEKDGELRRRKVRSQEQAQKLKAVQPEKLRVVEHTVEKSWVGSIDLREALINGDTCPKGDGMLLQSFERLWNPNSDARSESDGAEIGLLQSMNEKAMDQAARLRRWQSFHDRLQAAKPPSTRSSRPTTSGSHRSGIRFDRHRNLNLSDLSEEHDKQLQKQRPQRKSALRYDKILAAMREDLRKNSAHRTQEPNPEQSNQPLKRSQTQPIPLRRLSVAIDASPGARDPHSGSPSQTAVPMRRPSGRRVASRSRSYQQPKVEGQREPIPLKSEIFSPLKEKKGSSPGASLLPSPAEEEESPGGVDWAEVNERKKDSEEGNLVGRHEGLEVRTRVMSNGFGSKNEPSVHTNGTGSEETPTPSAKFEPLARTVEKAQSAGAVTTRPSLAERTRKSMAFTSAENINGFLPNGKETTHIDSDTPEKLHEPTQSAALDDYHTTLLDRTRQSISLAPPSSAQVPRSKKQTQPSHTRSRTSVYPINQFETPQMKIGRGARRSTVNGIDDEPKQQRIVTPMEKLLSPDAEYDSVFKSRPKIAMSPVLSPCADVDANGLEAEMGRSSPLTGIAGKG